MFAWQRVSQRVHVVCWSNVWRSGTNLLQVAVHELGHSLGLGHSDEESAIMAPFYRGYKPNFSLDQDDIDGIRYLYGQSGFKHYWTLCAALIWRLTPRDKRVEKIEFNGS